MQQDISVSLGDIFKFIRRGLLLALVLAAIGAAVMYYISSQRDPVYESSAVMLVTLGDLDLGSFEAPVVTPPPISPDAYEVPLKGPEVIGAALTALGEEVTPQRVASISKRLNLATPEGSSFRDGSQITLELTGDNPQGVAATLNALANALINWDQQRAETYIATYVTQLGRTIETTQSRIAELEAAGGTPEALVVLQNTLASLRTNQAEAAAVAGTAISRVEISQLATVPTSPFAPRPTLDAIIAAVIGVLLAYTILLVRNLLDTRLRSVDDLEAVSSLPILGEFPRPPKKTRRLPREAAGYLRTNLLLATQNTHPKVILVTSPGNGEGKSSVALSLAESFTRANYHTLLVDADLRQPVIAREYNLDDNRHMPLRTHLENPHGSYEAAHVGVNLAQTLDIIPTFRAAPSPTELLSLGFPDCLESWQKDYDVIVIDSAPLLDVADTLTIAPLCTGTVLVASFEDTDPQQITDAVELLQRSGVRIFGLAATFVGRSSARANYRYSRDATELLDEREQTAPSKRPTATNLSSGRSR